MRKIIDELIHNFKSHLICEEKSVLTIEKYMRDLKRFKERYDCADITKEAVITYKQELIRAEYERLLVAAGENKKLYYLMQTICSTGIRISDDI